MISLAFFHFVILRNNEIEFIVFQKSNVMRKVFLSIVLLVSIAISNHVMAGGAPSVKLMYFHGLHRCATCIAIERETKAALQNELKDMTKAKKVSMEVFTIEDAKNESVVKKYDIWGSTLLIVDEKGNKLADLTEEGFKLVRTQPEKFRSVLKEKVETLLKK